MHIYAFGSVCRGEIDKYSDIDLLAITSDIDNDFDSLKYSIYSYSRIKELWQAGNAFAWHLYYESRLLFASNSKDFLKELKEPSDYCDGIKDCTKFLEIFETASSSLLKSKSTRIYDLSVIFLAIRNFATCYSLSFNNPVFSRNSAKMLEGNSILLNDKVYNILERARILSTRGLGSIISDSEINHVILEINNIRNWMVGLLSLMKVNYV